MTHITIFLSIWIFLGGWGYFELRKDDVINYINDYGIWNNVVDFLAALAFGPFTLLAAKL